MSAFANRVRQVIRDLGPGEVTTYGDVAIEAGYPGAARAVGNLLRGAEGLPWWRVVAVDGRLVPGLEAEQSRLLAREGVHVSAGRVRQQVDSPAVGAPHPHAALRGTGDYGTSTSSSST